MCVSVCLSVCVRVCGRLYVCKYVSACECARICANLRVVCDELDYHCHQLQIIYQINSSFKFIIHQNVAFFSNNTMKDVMFTSSPWQPSLP